MVSLVAILATIAACYWVNLSGYLENFREIQNILLMVECGIRDIHVVELYTM